MLGKFQAGSFKNMSLDSGIRLERTKNHKTIPRLCKADAFTISTMSMRSVFHLKDIWKKEYILIYMSPRQILWWTGIL